jgi:hypothetical protein
MVCSQIARQVFHLDCTVPSKATERSHAARRRHDALSLVKVVIQSAAQGKHLGYLLIFTLLAIYFKFAVCICYSHCLESIAAPALLVIVV